MSSSGAKSKVARLTRSLFFTSFNTSKCKTAAKLAVARIKLLRNKRQVVVRQMRRDIAMLLQSGQDATARIRVEHVMREQNILAANEFIDLFCELIVQRLTIIAKQRACPADLKEGISSLIFAAPRCSEFPELVALRDIFEKKYGQDFVTAATDLRPDCGVNRMLIDKLSVRTPAGELKLKVLKEIAKEYQIDWDTTESETELLKLRSAKPVRSLLPLQLQSQSHGRKNTQPPITFPSSDLSAAKTLFTSLTTKQQHSPPPPRFCNSVLSSFSSVSSSLQDSVSFLNHITNTHPSFTPDRSSYHILLSHSSDLSNVTQALTLMASKGFQPDNVTTDIAIRTLCSAGHVDHAVHLIKTLSQVPSTRPDTYTFNFLVKTLVKTRTLTAVTTFMDEMKKGFGVSPDLVTYTILIDNVCNRKNLREAMRLLAVLREQGFKPDCYLFNTIMKGYCTLSYGGEVLKVYKTMIEEQVKPDLVTYNTLIYGLSKSGKAKEAMKFLKEMAKTGHFPDVVTYTSLMNGLCRDGNALGALDLLGEMESKGCNPNDCTYNTLLHGLCKARQLDKAVELYGVMKEDNMKLESGAYGTLLRALCRSGKVAEAYEVFDYAVESRSLTDVAAYTTLETTLKWLKKAKEQGLAV